MRAGDLLRETGSALDSNRGRSLLTVLGIVIGIAAVIAMTALIDGVKYALVGQLGLNRARLVYIYCWTPYGSVTANDLDKWERDLPEYEFITGTAYGWGDMTAGANSSNGQIMGTYPEFFDAMGINLVKGRFYTEREVDKGSLVIVIDETTARTLFGAEGDALGKAIKIGNYEFEVIGVTEASQMTSNTSYMPFSTLNTRVNNSTRASTRSWAMRARTSIPMRSPRRPTATCGRSTTSTRRRATATCTSIRWRRSRANSTPR